MSRGRRAVRVKPVTVDGFKFASQGEALRYQGLKTLAGASLQADVSTAGSMLVCQWVTTLGRRQVQTFTLKQAGKNKYNARKVVVGDVTYDSEREWKRHVQLMYRVAAGEIDQLVHHPPPYELWVNGVKIGQYTCDFIYRIVATGLHVVEDSKSEATRQARDYPLRKKLMLAPRKP